MGRGDEPLTALQCITEGLLSNVCHWQQQYRARIAEYGDKELRTVQALSAFAEGYLASAIQVENCCRRRQVLARLQWNAGLVGCSLIACVKCWNAAL